MRGAAWARPAPSGDSNSSSHVHLYKTDLPVADTKVAQKFYREIAGLPLAYNDPTRDPSIGDMR